MRLWSVAFFLFFFFRPLLLLLSSSAMLSYTAQFSANGKKWFDGSITINQTTKHVRFLREWRETRIRELNEERGAEKQCNTTITTIATITTMTTMTTLMVVMAVVLAVDVVNTGVPLR